MADSLENIIERCKKDDRKAQKELYDLYSPLFFAISLRYMKTYDKAEDVLISSFYKIFSKLDSYKNQGSFEGWMKRIVVNEALMELRKKNALNLSVELSNIHDPVSDYDIISSLTYQELLALIDELPTGYRTVFNMYVIEGYKHREIADLLGVSINTSKSQLILAKKKLKEIIKKKQIKIQVSNDSNDIESR